MKYTLETLQRAYNMYAFVDSQDFVFFGVTTKRVTRSPRPVSASGTRATLS